MIVATNFVNNWKGWYQIVGTNSVVSGARPEVVNTGVQEFCYWIGNDWMNTIAFEASLNIQSNVQLFRLPRYHCFEELRLAELWSTIRFVHMQIAPTAAKPCILKHGHTLLAARGTSLCRVSVSAFDVSSPSRKSAKLSIRSDSYTSGRINHM